jgi:hypothetical protein
MVFERLEYFLNAFYQRCTRGSTMKRNISRNQRLTDRGSIPKEKSSFPLMSKGDIKTDAWKGREEA